MKKYTDTHEWIDPETGEIGISAHAQKELGDIVYVELPTLGATVRKGDPLAVLESTKAAADVYAPVSGTVEAVNLDLKEKPEWINQSPLEKGWIARLQITHPEELDGLHLE